MSEREVIYDSWSSGALGEINQDSLSNQKEIEALKKYKELYSELCHKEFEQRAREKSLKESIHNITKKYEVSGDLKKYEESIAFAKKTYINYSQPCEQRIQELKSQLAYLEASDEIQNLLKPYKKKYGESFTMSYYNEDESLAFCVKIDNNTVLHKKSYSVFSLLSLILSILGVIIYGSLFKGSGLVPLFVVVGLLAVIFPAIAKKMRTKQNKKGRIIEIIAIVIGGFDFYCIIFALTDLPMVFAYLGWVIGAFLYKKIAV